MNHPEPAEWMAFLYGEAAPERTRELDQHLTECSVCAAQVSGWRAGMSALDDWKLPATRATAPWTLPVIKWAAAAAVVLCAGFLLGRQFSPANAELAGLKASMAQLAHAVERDRGVDLTNSVAIATAAANTETLRLLSAYSQVQADQRATDQQAIGLALRNVDSRLNRLRSELETVALNTASGFEQTRDNFARLASYSAPLPNDTSKP